MTVDLRNPQAWLVETTELDTFLDLAYSDHYGEIWLFNNDLEVIRGEDTFRELYLERIAGRLKNNIDAVKILIRPDQASAFFGPNPDSKLINKFRQIATMPDGVKRLSTFYFGVANDVKIPGNFGANPPRENTWVFYTHRGHLDLNSGVVMVRNAQFPFAGPEHRIVVVWLLRDQQVLQKRLKEVFQSYFHNTDIFSWMKVKSTEPFDFELVKGTESPETKSRRLLREDQNAPTPLSLRDRVDVAIVAALPEEMAALEKILGGETRPTPLPRDSYRYVLFKSKNGWRTVLLATLNSQGGVPAAAITWDLLEKWKPNHVILVGVAGGDPRETTQRLGDVVIGEIVLGYELAKVKGKKVLSRPRTYEPDLALRNAAGKACKHWPKTFKDLKRPEGHKASCKVHLMAIGSGSKLVAGSGFFKFLGNLHEKIHATEMEGDGVGYACDQHPIGAHMLVVKGIMDRSDGASRASELRDEWKRYAAVTAAQFVRDVLEHL
jgi:nucleoside phosphorylase